MPIVQMQGLSGIWTKQGDERVTIATTSENDVLSMITFTKEVSVSCWFMAPTPTTTGSLVSQTQAHPTNTTSGNFKGWRLDYKSGQIVFSIATDYLGGDKDEIIATPPGLGLVWTHAVGVMRRDKIGYFLKLYVNGRPVSDDGIPGFGPEDTEFPPSTPFPTTLDLAVGGSTVNGGQFIGDLIINRVRIFRRGLSELEVAALYKREKTPFRRKTLYLPGQINDDIPLYTAGHGGLTGYAPLFMEGDSATLQVGLFVEGSSDSIDGFVPLTVFGGGSDSAILGATRCFTIGDTANTTAGLDLFVFAPDNGDIQNNIPLWVNGEYASVLDSLPLLTYGNSGDCPINWQDWDTNWEDIDTIWNCDLSLPSIDGNIPFFLAGYPIAANEDSLKLFLKTIEGGVCNLYLQGPGTEYIGPGLTAFIRGAEIITDGVTLVIPNTTGYMIDGMPVYINGW